MNMPAAIALLLFAAAPACGQDLIRFDPIALPGAALEDRSIMVGEPATFSLAAAASLSLEQTPPAAGVFGKADGTWWLHVSPAVASDLGDQTSAGLRVGATTFVADDIQVGGELGVWYFQQPQDNAFGVNPQFILRWHFVDSGAWTVFADVGVGVLIADHDVPAGGTSFNLMPRAGVGFTYQLTDSGTRLEAGLSWHHISNARINGDDENPSRDLPMLHVGVIFPL